MLSMEETVLRTVNNYVRDANVQSNTWVMILQYNRNININTIESLRIKICFLIQRSIIKLGPSLIICRWILRQATYIVPHTAI